MDINTTFDDIKYDLDLYYFYDLISSQDDVRNAYIKKTSDGSFLFDENDRIIDASYIRDFLECVEYIADNEFFLELTDDHCDLILEALFEEHRCDYDYRRFKCLADKLESKGPKYIFKNKKKKKA